ncbi:hypothetical protein [Bartonella quintana]|uniref:hypothetical protein n=1 Tax=Bartonella quintana TaxID=803 RepID=UPI001249B78F|nr:hypothetical protein [Bartonella quintana]
MLFLLFAKILPLQVTGEAGADVKTGLRVEIVPVVSKDTVPEDRGSWGMWYLRAWCLGVRSLRNVVVEGAVLAGCCGLWGAELEGRDAWRIRPAKIVVPEDCGA